MFKELKIKNSDLKRKRKKIDAYRLQNISATINPTEMVTQFCWVTI